MDKVWQFSNNRVAYGVCVAILLIVVGFLPFTGFLQRIDAVFYDSITALQSHTPDDRIVIVAIDETSLRVLGRWPWSRRVHAELIERLATTGKNVVALDLLFSEPDYDDPDADQSLSEAIAMHGNVVLPVAPAVSGDSKLLYLNEPIQPLRAHATLGHVDVELDLDGIVRRAFLMAGIDTPDWPALGFALIERMENLSVLQQKVSRAVMGGDAIQGRWVRSNEVLVPYAGPPGTYPQVSYAQVLYDDGMLETLENKLIIVGMTAMGMGTRFATPVSPISRQPMSGVEWQANVADMLQNNRVVYPVTPFTYAVFSVLWVALLLLAVRVLKIDFLAFPLFIALVGCLILVGSIYIFFHLWVPPTAAVLGTLAVYPLWSWRRINGFVQSLFLAKERLHTTLDSVGDGVITTDTHDRVTYFNRGAEKIVGLDQAQANGKLLPHVLNLSLMQNDHFGEVKERELSIAQFGTQTFQCYLTTPDSEQRSVRITRHKLCDEKEQLSGFVIAITDVTNTVELTQQVAHQASHDALTKLPNRELLHARFGQMIADAQITDVLPAVIVFFVTLDSFKKINDALGHRAGDELLVQVAQRLEEIISNEYDGIVARWGGDEFVLLVDKLGGEKVASSLAQAILFKIGSKFKLDDQDVFVTASIGVSFYPKDGIHSDAVLERAGAAMYRVKHEGGNSFSFYSQESSVIWTRDRLELEKELHAAILNNELTVLYQPIIDINQECVVRMEALVRWPHAHRGLLSPGDFIPIAERTGMINKLGEMVLRSACVAAHNLLVAKKPVSVAVNVAPVQLLHGNFVETVSQVLQETTLPAQHLILEITESAIVSDMAHAASVLTKIKALGVSIALDDFGTGYSSLSLLRELPIDILKIDKSFTRTLDQNIQDLTIIQAVTGLGKNLSMSVIAEGVESEKQMQILFDQHCFLQQGYHFSPPVSYETLLGLMDVSNKLSPIQIRRVFDSSYHKKI